MLRTRRWCKHSRIELLLSVGLIVMGALTWLVGGNLLLWPHSEKRRVFGPWWVVRVHWLSLGLRDWLRLLALAAAALTLMAMGLFTLRN